MQSNLHIQCNSSQNSNGFFSQKYKKQKKKKRNIKSNPKISTDPQKPMN